MTRIPDVPHKHRDPDDEGNSWESAYEENGVELPYHDQEEAILPVPEHEIVQLTLTKELQCCGVLPDVVLIVR